VNHFPLEGSGSGIYTKNLARELAEMGNDVKVIFPEHEDLSFPEFETRVIKFNNGKNSGYELDYNFPCFTSHPRSVNTYYELTDDQMKEYIDTFVRITKEEVESFKPDIIHAQHLWITPYAAAQTGVPYIVTAHGTDLKGFVKDERYHSYALEGAAKAAKIITISKQVDAEANELYKLESGKTEIVMNGYDEGLFMPKDLSRSSILQKFNIDKEPKYIVSFAGKMTHFKGIDVLLKAARVYERELDHSVMTLIAGNGELYDELTSLKNELGLKDTYFLGHVNQNQLVEIYNIADVSTVPSRTEPFGLVAIEAMACGTPVVGTNQGGLPDFVTEDVGTLVDVDDDLGLADAIVNEIQRTDKDNRATGAHEYALKHFSWKHSIKRVDEIYREHIKS